MPPPVWRATLGVVDLALAMSATSKCAIVLLFTGVVAPLIGIVFRRVAGGWETIGKGPFAIEQQLPTVPRYLNGPRRGVDPAIQAAEVRQMLIAKQERQERRGESPLDVQAEAARRRSAS